MLGSYLANTRRNHALEHATVSLLLARLGPNLRLVGRAGRDGFFIYGAVPQDALASCASEGLRRLQQGEAFWAVTPLCGTNIATAGILSGIAATLALGNGDAKKDRLGGAVLACMLAAVVAQPVGRLIQQHLTTSPDLADTEIVSIESREDGRFHRVRTRRLDA